MRSLKKQISDTEPKFILWVYNDPVQGKH